MVPDGTPLIVPRGPNPSANCSPTARRFCLEYNLKEPQNDPSTATNDLKAAPKWHQNNLPKKNSHKMAPEWHHGNKQTHFPPQAHTDPSSLPPHSHSHTIPTLTPGPPPLLTLPLLPHSSPSSRSPLCRGFLTFPSYDPVAPISIITIFLQQKLYYSRATVVRAVIIPRSLPG